MVKIKLAMYGGKPLREWPLPYRRLFGQDELQSVIKVFKDSWQNEVDFGFQGKYEKLYTNAFCEFQGGGYADAVSSGTAALFIALAALDISPGSEILFSPVTDPGGISPALLMGMVPVIADSLPDSFNIGPEEFDMALTANTKVAVITHLGGTPVDISPIIKIARDKGVRVIEDCSQAHGALYKEKRVGRFGDIAFFSTMFSKIHATGGCGGLIYTEHPDLYQKLRSLADRGKPFFKHDFNPKNPCEFLFPALNFNQNELSCAIGVSTLAKLQTTINKRLEIVRKIDNELKESRVVCSLLLPDYAVPSPFFLTVKVDTGRLKVSKEQFAKAIAAEGVWINPDYKYVVSEWEWIKKYFKREMHTPNASQFRKESFNILINERFTDNDISDIVACILKVESVLGDMKS